MANQSKVTDLSVQFILSVINNKAKFGASLVAILVAINVLKNISNSSKERRRSKSGKFNVKKGEVNADFMRKLLFLLKIVIPTWKSSSLVDLVLLTVALVARTYLSIYLATVKGNIVKEIVNKDFNGFIRALGKMAICSLPGSFINSSMVYLGRRLSINFRDKMSNYMLKGYLKDKVFYQITNLDQRIENPDHRLTADIEKWSQSLSSLYSNVSKPILDLILFSRNLTGIMGSDKPLMVIGWYLFTAVIIRTISPAFGKLIAMEQNLEGDYRARHNDLVNHAEEIAFYRGNDWEYTKIKESFSKLIAHSFSIMRKRLVMGVFDSILVKYGAHIVGLGIIASATFQRKLEGDKWSKTASMTKDYVMNSSLLVDLAIAVGRLVISYKSLQLVAGYTSLIYDCSEVIEDLKMGKFDRKITQGDGEQSLDQLNKGILVETDCEDINIENIPIVTPNGETLIERLDLIIKPGMNIVITGPNGAGKSSLFRILACLWPLLGGKISRPTLEKMFYVPQRPYMPSGTLRDQIIYPHKKLEMRQKGVTDDDLAEILKEIGCDYLLARENGFEAEGDWNYVLSGGEKQRLAMARLFYHKPIFAILDECTSSTSLDVEALLYNKAKSMGITLFTISHRLSLFKYHEHVLKFDGEGGWIFVSLQEYEEML